MATIENQWQTPEHNQPADELALSHSRSDDFFLDRSLSLDEKLQQAQFYKPTFKGMIELIIGPMFAGKSTELLRRVQRHAISGKSCLYVKYAADTRYDNDCISTHDLLKQNARAVTRLTELGEDWQNYDVLGIDEGQFYDDVVEFCEDAAHAGKIVIVSALGGTYQREGFNSILDLVPKAEKIKNLHAICKICYAQASFTLRTSEEQSIELIGGGEAYMPVCRECFLQKTQEQEDKQKAKVAYEVSEITYGAENGSPEDEAKLIVSTQRSSTGCDTTHSSAASPEEPTIVAMSAATTEALQGSPMCAGAPFTDGNESPETLKQ